MNPIESCPADESGLPQGDAEIIARTRRWLERVVIGLNLCPFAQPVHAGNRIRFCVCRATTETALLAALSAELEFLRTADPNRWETTLLIHPDVLREFAGYNQFLGDADGVLRGLRLDRIIQIASFHPDYQFAGTDPGDITNHTNRSPYPMLHLLRESSVQRAVSGPEDAARIVERNLETLRKLGPAGLKRLEASAPDPAATQE